MSDQAREDVYEKTRIHRRGKGIPLKDDGITLDDRKKGLS